MSIDRAWHYWSILSPEVFGWGDFFLFTWKIYWCHVFQYPPQWPWNTRHDLTNHLVLKVSCSPVPRWPDFLNLVPVEEVAGGGIGPIVCTRPPFLMIDTTERGGDDHRQRAHTMCGQPQVPQDTGEAPACSHHLYPRFIQRLTLSTIYLKILVDKKFYMAVKF